MCHSMQFKCWQGMEQMEPNVLKAKTVGLLAANRRFETVDSSQGWIRPSQGVFSTKYSNPDQTNCDVESRRPLRAIVKRSPREPGSSSSRCSSTPSIRPSSHVSTASPLSRLRVVRASQPSQPASQPASQASSDGRGYAHQIRIQIKSRKGRLLPSKTSLAPLLAPQVHTVRHYRS